MFCRIKIKVTHISLVFLILVIGVPLNSVYGSENDQKNQVLRITVEGVVIRASLNKSETIQEFIDLLPLSLKMTRWGDREYYGKIGKLSLAGEQIDDFINGDLTFYPPSGSLAIFYANEKNSDQANLLRMGTITSDLYAFQSLSQSATFHLELVGE